MQQTTWYDPGRVRREYESGARFKNGLCPRGLYEQTKINERMYIGDQWHGAQTGDKPLVRYNIVKRIGDYKLAVAAGNNVTVNYTAEGVPDTGTIRAAAAELRRSLKETTPYPTVADVAGPAGKPTAADVRLAMSALSDYHRVTAERVKLDDKKAQALRKAYISGTGILYTYWDSAVTTGLYADEGMTSAVKGDIQCEVLDVENVYFGNPTCDDVQSQPYILIAHRRELADVVREARANHLPTDGIRPDEEPAYSAPDTPEPEDLQKVTVITKFYKDYAADGTVRILAAKVTAGAVVRAPWDTKLRLYPIAKMSWETKSNCIYGDSEVTHLVPNQIAINRSITASVWAVMQIGMPSMVVNGDIVPDEITNDPGQIIRVCGSPEEVDGAVRYVAPPNFSPQFDELVNSLISNTQTQAGANAAALGDIRPDNMSAIIAVREAATLPMQLLQNRFYSFLEDNARIWAEYWLQMYGTRALKMRDEDGDWYMPFCAERYKDLMVSARIDVGAVSPWSQMEERQTLDDLYKAGILNARQYLERLPKGSVPDVAGLLEDLKNAPAVPESEEG